MDGYITMATQDKWQIMSKCPPCDQVVLNKADVTRTLYTFEHKRDRLECWDGGMIEMIYPPIQFYFEESQGYVHYDSYLVLDL